MNSSAPPFDFLDRCFLPVVRRMGPTVDLTLDRHGFVPAGGGKIIAHIKPAHMAGFDLLERGTPKARRTRALLSKLAAHIGERQVQTVDRLLRWPADDTGSEVVQVHSPGPGTICVLDLEFEHATEVISAPGRRGLSSEKVAKVVVKEAQSYLDLGAPVGPHLADQLLMPLALSACAPSDAPVRRGGSFRTGPLTMHTTTHLDILRRFLPIESTVVAQDDDTFVITVLPREER